LTNTKLALEHYEYYSEGNMAKIKVLDQGYVELIEAWGTGKAGACDRLIHLDAVDYEVGIIEAARQSTQGSFRGWDTDEKLLETIFYHQSNQSTPFEAAGMTIEVEAPIFVFREWHRHRTQSYNEASARYRPLEPKYYRPDGINLMERSMAAQTDRNKQAQASEARQPVTSENLMRWLDLVDMTYLGLEATYQEALKMGIPKELARITMPVGHYSCMRASANLRNWLSFLTLRLSHKAQWEIRQYAEAVNTLVRLTFPRTWRLFADSMGWESGD
jgi:thymidylate synthase (FAD)